MTEPVPHSWAPVMIVPEPSRIELEVGARRTRERRPPAGRDPDGLVGRQLTTPADGRGRGLEGLDRADPLHHLARRTGIALPEEVPTAELDRVHADLRRQCIVVLLDGPADRRSRRSPDGAGRLGVRVHDLGGDVDVRDAVRTDGEHRGHLGEVWLVHAVCAVVDDEPAAPADDQAVEHRPGLELDDHPLPAVIRQEELVAAREDQLDRAPDVAGERGDLRLESELTLRPEPAAEMGHDDPDLVLRHLEGLGDSVLDDERDLGRRPDRDLVAMPLGDDGPRLDRHGMRAVGLVAATDDDVGRHHRSLRVPPDDRRAGRDVVGTDEVLVGVVLGPALVDERA